MNLVLLSLKMLRRDWRAGELRILALALIIAVSSITTVGFFADRVQLALAQESNRLLGADLVVTSDRPIPIEFATQAEHLQLKIVNLIRFPSMVSKGDHNLLAEIRAVSPGYPLRGELKMMDRPNENATEENIYLAEGIPTQGTIWIDEKLLLGLETALDEKLEVGIAEMTVTSIVAREPDHSVGFINMGPRLLMNIEDLAETQLIQPGSRVTYQLLVAGKESDVAQFRDWVQPKLVQGQRVEGIRDARPEIRAALERAEKFLSLAALVSVIVAAAAIALSSRRFIQRHLDGCAVMRCLGASQTTLFSLYFYHLVLFGLVASTIGCVLGLIAQAFLSNWMAELVNSTLPWPSSDPAIYGLI
ncbi:MAG TPA: FtsX-like permease family protein, partial [Nitrosomonas sp.]|nr:FtsX-like permease family protein [Nitrosomonas sp.]